MAYNANTNIENEKKYLQNLAATGTAGQQAWAKSQMQELNKFASSQPTAQKPQAVTQPQQGGVQTALGTVAGGGTYSTDSQGNKWYTVNGQDYNMGAAAQIAQATAPKAPTIDNTYAQLLAKQQAEQEKAMRERINQGVAQLEGSKQGVDQAYEQAARQSYILNQKQNAMLPQQMAAMGITGGLAQRGLQDTSLAYQNAQNQARLARDNQITNIDRDVQNLKATGDISIAENAAQYQAKLAEALQQAQLRQQEQANWQAQFDAQNQRWQAEFGAEQDALAYNQASVDYKNRLALAQYMAQYGDFSGLRALGIDTSALERQYAIDTAPKTSVNRAGGSGGSTVQPLTFEDSTPTPSPVNRVVNPATLVPYGQEQAFDQVQAANLAQRGFTPEQIATIMNANKNLLSWRG